MHINHMIFIGNRIRGARNQAGRIPTNVLVNITTRMLINKNDVTTRMLINKNDVTTRMLI